MSRPLTDAERQQLREDAVRQHDAAERLRQATGGKTGWRARWTMWQRAKIETTRKSHPILDKAATAFKWAIVKPIKYVVVIPAKLAIPLMFTYEGKDGHRHFAPKRSAFSTVALTLTIALRSYIAMGAYYYGTYRTSNIYVPNAGVFLNQQFEHPNVPGRIATPRDEIYTVHGKVLEENGKLDDFRGVVDSNLYFFWKRSAWNPGLLAANMTPQSPYGALCRTQETGGYIPFPRAIKPLFNMAKNVLGAQVEIVGASCQQLKEVPSQYIQTDAPENGQKTPPAIPAKPAAAPAEAPKPETPKSEASKEEPKPNLPQTPVPPAVKPQAPTPDKK